MMFELDMKDPRQKKVWEYWLNLTRTGDASSWARLALINALPRKAGDLEQELHYEDINE